MKKGMKRKMKKEKCIPVLDPVVLGYSTETDRKSESVRGALKPQ